MNDSGVFVMKERCDKLVRPLVCITQEEGTLIQESCKAWRCVENMLVQPRIGAAGTSPRGLKQKMFQEEVDDDTRKAENRRLVCS